MIDALPDDNVVFLVELMQRFMMPKETKIQDIKSETTGHADFMQELEKMRIKVKAYFPSDLEYEKVLGEAMAEKNFTDTSSNGSEPRIGFEGS